MVKKVRLLSFPCCLSDQSHSSRLKLTLVCFPCYVGCSVARLDEFIKSYHTRRSHQHPQEPIQLLDTAYRDFVWSKLCELDQVRIGILETGQKPEQELQALSPPAISDQASCLAPDDGSEYEPVPSGSHHPLEIPAVAANAANQMTQRKTRLSLSANKRSLIDKRPASTPATGIPALSIGQQRAVQTGKVPKNRLVVEPPKEPMTKRSRREAKPTATLSLREWRELDVKIIGLRRTELLQMYGFDEEGQSKLRIAVDPMTCWKAVVGTDTRVGTHCFD